MGVELAVGVGVGAGVDVAVAVAVGVAVAVDVAVAVGVGVGVDVGAGVGVAVGVDVGVAVGVGVGATSGCNSQNRTAERRRPHARAIRRDVEVGHADQRHSGTEARPARPGVRGAISAQLRASVKRRAVVRVRHDGVDCHAGGEAGRVIQSCPAGAKIGRAPQVRSRWISRGRSNVDGIWIRRVERDVAKPCARRGDVRWRCGERPRCSTIAGENTRPPLATNPIIFGFVFATPMLRR